MVLASSLTLLGVLIVVLIVALAVWIIRQVR